jgi:outer membrane receptor protein involved in Fe transport
MNSTGKRWLWPALIFCINIIFLQVRAQAPVASLKGKVIDAKTREPLVGATVVLVGTYKGGTCDVDGKYTIKNIKPEDYSIRVVFIGYTEKIFNGVHIAAGDNNVLNAELNENTVQTGTVEIVGERPLINIESGRSESKVSSEEIKEMNTVNLKEILSMQVGVSQNPDGIQIRGGRVYETQYMVDGANAQDPLAGTGFGVDVAPVAIDNLTVITSGSDAEYGSGSSGVIKSTIKEGGDHFTATGSWQRDNMGTHPNSSHSWNTDIANIAIGTPIPGTNKKLTLFASANALMSDDYYHVIANQLYSSAFANPTLWAPRQDNSWSSALKLAYKLADNSKVTLSNTHSISVSQDTRALQIVGQNQIVTPGLQYDFSLQPDNATTYTHQMDLTVLNYNRNLSNKWRMDGTLSRLFASMRADANGRPFRDPSVDKIYDPASIVKDPISVYNPKDSAVYVNPGPGLINNGGLATKWHDHYAQTYSLKLKFNYNPNQVHYFTFGMEHSEEEYQWVDVISPWIGAPIRINDSVTTPSTRIGSSNDIWKVNPAEGGVFVSDNISYKGILAYLGMRYNYWAPGKYVDDAIANSNAPVLDATRQSYMQHTSEVFGRRFKSRLLPKLSVSFPVTENNVFYFNYGHSMRLASPQFIYAGLNPVYQDRSFLSNLGNPDINPEVTVSYELGLKSQINKDLAFTLTAFYNDKFDYIVSRTIQVKDQTGHYVEKTFYINQDYARIRGLEAVISKRIGKSLRLDFNAQYQIATGKSNSALESKLQVEQNGFVTTSTENYLAWDRPIDLKFSVIWKPDSTITKGSLKFLKNFRFFVSSSYKSGLRYTPYTYAGVSPTGRPMYEAVQNAPYSKVGSAWFWTDIKISRDFPLDKKKGRMITLSVDVRNIFNNLNSQIINGVTGTAYRTGDPLPYDQRDPRYTNPQDTGTPPYNPARYMAPRQLLFGLAFQF